jgi:hypothetical protein
MYGSLIEVLGDEPSADGYYSDQMTGKGRPAARGLGAAPGRIRG